MKLAIMQPYFFPYIGYFQLVNAVDKFIFYDDVNYIKGGWINRNNILINKEKKLFTLNLVGASSFKQINQIKVGNRSDKLLKTIHQSYVKAPFFISVMPLIEDVFASINTESLVSDVAGISVMKVSEFLGLKTIFEFSSFSYSHTKGMERGNRLLEICKLNNSSYYINPVGGIELYSKEHFRKQGINLQFLNSKLSKYSQFTDEFVPGLSIIDVLMFNPIEQINLMLNNYTLE